MKTTSAPWAVNLLTIREIPIRVHLTFFLLPIWVAYEEAGHGGNPFSEVIFVLLLFLCVLLHELGHALVARRFDIRTRDIVLYPFGGIATLLSEAKPKAELIIAAAGPLVNIVLATILFFIMPENTELLGSNSLFARVFQANVVLAIFNLIPALPMDGGRILRALLAIFHVRRATIIASRISQVLSVLIGILGFTSENPILIVIGILVFSSAMQEILRVRARSTVHGRNAGDLMIEASRLESFTHGTTVPAALDRAVRSLQPCFPVIYNGQLLGILDKEELIRAAALKDEGHYISHFMDREFISVSSSENLSRALEIAQEAGADPIAVVDDGVFKGFLFKETVLEYMLIDGLREADSPDTSGGA